MLSPAIGKWLGIELVEVSVTEKLVAALGGGLAVLVVVDLSGLALPGSAGVPVVASMGASAVLLFDVPHGPLSQPWPVLAGHGVSAVIGVACARVVPHTELAVACAVGGAIGAMHQLKCIHPPGGATAFTAVLGGDAVRQLGFGFVVFPVLTNALAMVLLAVVLNAAFPWRRYPSALNRVPKPRADAGGPPSHAAVLAALRSLDSFVDVSEDDLIRLTDALAKVPAATATARHGTPRPSPKPPTNAKGGPPGGRAAAVR